MILQAKTLVPFTHKLHCFTGLIPRPNNSRTLSIYNYIITHVIRFPCRAAWVYCQSRYTMQVATLHVLYFIIIISIELNDGVVFRDKMLIVFATKVIIAWNNEIIIQGSSFQISTYKIIIVTSQSFITKNTSHNIEWITFLWYNRVEKHTRIFIVW